MSPSSRSVTASPPVEAEGGTAVVVVAATVDVVGRAAEVVVAATVDVVGCAAAIVVSATVVTAATVAEIEPPTTLPWSPPSLQPNNSTVHSPTATTMSRTFTKPKATDATGPMRLATVAL